MTRDEAKRILENIEFVRAFAEGKDVLYCNDPPKSLLAFTGPPSCFTIAEPKPERVKVAYYMHNEGFIQSAVVGSVDAANFSKHASYTQVEIENE